MTEIALPLVGGCLCGACRYELSAAPFLVYVCHCKDCQRQSGSAFGMSMPAPRPALRVTLGEPARYERVMPSGRTSVTRFCGQCATRLFAEASDSVVVLRPGTLDDASWVEPAAQGWSAGAHAWACIDGIPSHPRNPESYGAIARAWQAQGIRFR